MNSGEPPNARRRAVFLDRDGVLVADRELVEPLGPLVPLPGVPEALLRLRSYGFELAVVTNQTIVARGLASLEDVERAHAGLRSAIVASGGPAIEHFAVCPHHPHATVARYRLRCDCRKPLPGLIQSLEERLFLNLEGSWMVGDRASDVAAGRRAGCRTILVRGPMSTSAPIVGAEDLGAEGLADFECGSLGEAVDWIGARS